MNVIANRPEARLLNREMSEFVLIRCQRRMGQPMRTARWGFCCLIAPSLSACATIFGQATQVVQFRTEPPGADLSVSNRRGVEVWRGTAPSLVPLRAGAGFWAGESYLVTASKDDHSATVLVDTTVHWGYLLGNAIFGGLLGWLIVDPATGAMWYLPDEVVVNTDAYEHGLVENDSTLVSLWPKGTPQPPWPRDPFPVEPADAKTTDEVPRPEPEVEHRAVDEWRTPNGGKGQVVVVAPFQRNEASIRALARTLRHGTATDHDVLIFVFDDESAARQWMATDACQSPEVARACESHFVGRFNHDANAAAYHFAASLEGEAKPLQIDLE